MPAKLIAGNRFLPPATPAIDSREPAPLAGDLPGDDTRKPVLQPSKNGSTQVYSVMGDWLQQDVRLIWDEIRREAASKGIAKLVVDLTFTRIMANKVARLVRLLEAFCGDHPSLRVDVLISQPVLDRYMRTDADFRRIFEKCSEPTAQMQFIAQDKTADEVLSRIQADLSYPNPNSEGMLDRYHELIDQRLAGALSDEGRRELQTIEARLRAEETMEAENWAFTARLESEQNDVFIREMKASLRNTKNVGKGK